ncbi:PKD domain-containing protein, partial [Candidatus Bathyarchaeota archaeon]
MTATFPVNVTGGTAPFAYTVAVTSNATAGATTAQVVSFTATVAYNTAYNSAARSTTFSYLFMFGDGQIATLPGTTGLVGTVTHKYAAAGTYPVVVIVQETGSNALAKIQEVGRFSQLITSPGNALCPAATPCTITFTPTNPMVGQTVTFTANVNGGVAPYTFSWSFGDGSALATGNPATHMYSAKGTFTVKVNITDSSTPTHQTSTVTTTITVLPTPLADTVSGPTSGTVGTSVTFTVAANGGTQPYTFSWTATGGSPTSGTGTSFTTTYSVKGTYIVNATVTDFNGAKASPYTFSWTAVGGNPASGTGASFTTTYSVKGTYVVNATVTDFNGAKAFKTASITINPLALADTVTGPTSGTVGTSVTFNAAATGGTTPYTFSWTAVGGNPASGTGASFTTTYSVKGTYVVNATVTDFNAKKAFKTASITINPLPLADSVTGPISGTVGTSVTFNAAATGGTTPYTFSWTAIGGSPASGTGASFTTTYSVKGTYIVNATVTDFNGAKAFKLASITINPLPLADTVTGPASGTVGTSVTFNAAATGGTTPYTFTWTAVGGSPASGSGASFTTTYSVKGTYVVNATVTDFNGAKAFKTASITVNPLPLADTVTGPATGTVGTAVTFNAAATGGTTPYTFTWTAVGGNPASGSGASFTTTYSVKGTYTVNATVTDFNAKKAFKLATITINPLPLADTVTGPASGTVGTSVAFNAAATGGTTPYTFAWTAVGGSPASGTGASFTTTYSVKGTYTVNATVTDFNGVKAFKTASITINPLPLGDTVTGPASGTVGTAVTFNAAATGGTTPYT